MKKNNVIWAILLAIFVIGVVLVKHGVIEFGSEATNPVSYNAEAWTDDPALTQFELLNQGCGTYRCLFEREDDRITTGFFQATGYHTVVTEEYYGDENFCDAVVIVDGPEHLEDKDMVFLVNESFIDESDLAALRNSSENNVIDLDIVSEYHLTGKGAPECWSNLRIVDTDEHIQ